MQKFNKIEGLHTYKEEKDYHIKVNIIINVHQFIEEKNGNTNIRNSTKKIRIKNFVYRKLKF